MATVLIVEDYENIKNQYAEAFVRAGYSVDAAGSGNEALKKTSDQSFDVIILDMLMLDLSGSDFLQEFKAAEHPDTKVIVVSNLDSPGVIEKAKALGASAYLIKSQYTPQSLVDAVGALTSKNS